MIVHLSDIVPQLHFSDLHNVHNRLCDIELQLGHWQQHGNPQAGGEPSSKSSLDRALIAVGHSGSSLIVPMDEIAMLYLSDLGSDIVTDSLLAPVAEPPAICASAAYSPLSTAAVKAETASSLMLVGPSPPTVPPLQYFTQSLASARIIKQLPSSPSLRRKLLNAAAIVVQTSPSFNWRHLRHRIDEVLNYGDENLNVEGGELAHDGIRSKVTAPPTASLFAATTAAFALGALTSGDIESRDAESQDLRCASEPSHASLFALSVQSLTVHEFAFVYDLDYLIACILQVLYLLHSGRSQVSHYLYPLASFSPHTIRKLAQSSLDRENGAYF